jgi:hypothetical protein
MESSSYVTAAQKLTRDAGLQRHGKIASERLDPAACKLEVEIRRLLA